MWVGGCEDGGFEGGEGWWWRWVIMRVVCSGVEEMGGNWAGFEVPGERRGDEAFGCHFPTVFWRFDRK